jgi:hypothetical protein
MATITLPQLVWFSPKELKLTLPDGWQLKYCHNASTRQIVREAGQIWAAFGTSFRHCPAQRAGKR